MNDTQAHDRPRPWLHGLAVALCVVTFALIVWGGHVNTTRSGMAFPDWPTSNAEAMITYAPSKWLMENDKFWEHGHRLLATVVGLMTVVLGIGLYRAAPRERRPGAVLLGLMGAILVTMASAIVGFNHMPAGVMEGVMMLLALLMVGLLGYAFRVERRYRPVWLGAAAFVSVCLQGAFGGYTVRNNLPDWTSTTHGMLAEIFFMTILAIALATSRAWNQVDTVLPTMRGGLRLVVTSTWALTVVQFFLGALTRHSDAWGVSLDFPEWSEEGFFPSAEMMQYGQVVIHLVHRTAAYVVAAAVVAQWYLVRRQRAGRLSLTTSLAAIAVFVQIALGAAILFTHRGELVTTMHVMTGVVLLALNTITMYTMYRFFRIPSSSEIRHGNVQAVGNGGLS